MQTPTKTHWEQATSLIDSAGELIDGIGAFTDDDRVGAAQVLALLAIAEAILAHSDGMA